MHLCKLGYTYLNDNDIMVYDHKTDILPEQDERFVRIHKRIKEANVTRPDRPIISAEEYENC